MMRCFLFSIFVLVIPVIVQACEGECIVQITHAFVGNYSDPVQHVFADAAASIARTILPSHSTSAASKLVEPLLDAYEHDAYDSMRKAIFPGFFHGKCQVNGVDPAGCPKPDCPVVCGTPGSMVHFYGILKTIAFNSTTSGLESVCSPSSKTYQAFENAVLHAAHDKAPRRRSLRSTTLRPHGHHSFLSHSALQQELPTPTPGELQKRNGLSDAQVKTHLMSVCRGTIKDLRKKCGGGTGLQNCSWETAMKAYILSFP